ncbi:hypothetical protein EON66_00645, partial [archaeon]
HTQHTTMRSTHGGALRWLPRSRKATWMWIAGGATFVVLLLLALYPARSAFHAAPRVDTTYEMAGSVVVHALLEQAPHQPRTSADTEGASDAVQGAPLPALQPSVLPPLPPVQQAVTGSGDSSFAAGQVELPFTPLTAGREQALPRPHGGALVDLMLGEGERAEVIASLATGDIAHTWTLTPRQACDIELLLNGGFSPLTGFMTEEVYLEVIRSMRLGPAFNNLLWPMPIVLDVPDALAEAVRPSATGPAARIALRDAYHNLIAVLTVSSVYEARKAEEAQAVFGTTDASHPGTL